MDPIIGSAKLTCTVTRTNDSEVQAAEPRGQYWTAGATGRVRARAWGRVEDGTVQIGELGCTERGGRLSGVCHSSSSTNFNFQPQK
eukprot:2516466-Rhodomonas_salina.1